MILRNMTVYTRFNRFKHAINKDDKHKPMTRTGREAQAQHNDTTQRSIAQLKIKRKELKCKCKKCFK